MVKRFERSNQLPGVINPYTKTLIVFPHETRTALNPKSPKSLAIFLPEFPPKTPKTPEIQRQTDRQRFAKPCGDPEMHQTDRHAALPILVELWGRKLQNSMVKGFEIVRVP